ncbi:MAG: hypothetical protein ACE15C_14445 [Phycisphaerae bacterium]
MPGKTTNWTDGAHATNDLWETAGNWSNGVPVDGDTVVVPANFAGPALWSAKPAQAISLAALRILGAGVDGNLSTDISSNITITEALDIELVPPSNVPFVWEGTVEATASTVHIGNWTACKGTLAIAPANAILFDGNARIIPGGGGEPQTIVGNVTWEASYAFNDAIIMGDLALNATGMDGGEVSGLITQAAMAPILAGTASGPVVASGVISGGNFSGVVLATAGATLTGGTITGRLHVQGTLPAAVQDVRLGGAVVDLDVACEFGAADHPVLADGAVFRLRNPAAVPTMTNVLGTYSLVHAYRLAEAMRAGLL